MSSLITFRKEFEDIILKGKFDDILKTLVPNSAEKIYLQFCDEYKKCFVQKKITKELNLLIENANKNHLSKNLIKVFETKRNLLEYDFPSTSREKKDKIIDYLFHNYCDMNLNYNAPFFAREKNIENSEEQNEENKIPIELTDKMIQEAIEKEIEKNELNFNLKINYLPEKKRIQLFTEYVDTNIQNAINVFERGIKIPFHLMNKDQFTKVIKTLNQLKENLLDIYYPCFTIEQIMRLLKEVTNKMYIKTEKLINILINRKYNILIKKELKKNDLNEVKKILWEVYNLYKEYEPKHMPGTLLYILKINKLQNVLELNSFIEYIKNPLIDNRLYEQRNLYLNNISNDCSYSPIHIPSIYFEDINSHKFIENLLIDFFMNNAAKIDDFKNYFKLDYLKKIEYISKMYKGEEIKPDEFNKYLPNDEYEEIVKKIELTICEHNPKEFKIEEDVKIDFIFKNTKSINISIYEINTENYYLTKKTPLNSLINVEGVIASHTLNIKIEGGENPLKKIKKTIHFEQIPKNKRGVYLIEILGNGMSSRIIIKKGKLNLITRNTAKGILCQMINEKNEILKDDKTYIWYNNIKYTCGEKDGFIALPYKVLVDPSNKCILVHDSYADITEIKRKSENFVLKGYFNFSNESIISGNMLKVSFKPLLFSNGRETSLEQIKNGIIKVIMLKNESNETIPVTTIFDKIEFKDDNKEYEFEVLIPPMMKEMSFEFEGEIKISNKNDKIKLSYRQNSNFVDCNDKISIPLFHKVGKKYFYEYIGRNGESITTKAGTNTSVKIHAYDYLNPVDIQLQYDKLGRLNLGELNKVKSINIGGIKYNLQENSKYFYPERIDIIPGESFTLPLFSNKKILLEDNYFILFQYYTTKEEPCKLIDIKNEIILKQLDINGDKEHYYEFTLGQNLPKGKYCLIFGDEGNENYIIIKVKEGNHWMNYENYIINENGYVENSQNKTPVYMKHLSIDKEKGEIKFECAETRRNFKNIHANIYLSQYQIPEMNNYFNQYSNMLNEGIENLLTNKFSKWKNIYLSNRILNEEIQYVLQRQEKENQLGNSLPLPSLLLKRAFKRDCENEEENLEKGNEYKRQDEDMGDGFGSYYGRKKIAESKNDNTNFYNFLKYFGYVKNNIEPININNNEDKNAKFEIKFTDKEKDILKKYSYIQIILLDNKSISSDFHCLCEDNDKYEIEKRDISNNKVLDNNKNFSEISKIELVQKDKKITLDETSNYKLVDSIQKLSQFYLLSMNKNQYWDKFKFLLNLLDKDKFNENEFLEKYNEVCGHEVNLFLYFKYHELFEKYVKNIIKYKFEKTFIDYFLLDDYETLLEYLSPYKINKLPTNELCLLLLRIVNKNPEEAEKIKNIIKSRVKKPEDVENLILTNFNVMMNMKVEEDSDLKKIKMENEMRRKREEAERRLRREEEERRFYKMAMPMDPPRPMPFDNNKKMRMLESNYIPNRMNRMTRGRGGMARPPLMNVNYLNCAPSMSHKKAVVTKTTTTRNLTQADFIMQDRALNVNQAFERAEKEMGMEFEKPGLAKEYKERHYYIKEHKNTKYNEIQNPLWLDFAEHILKNKNSENFLSKYVLYNKIEFNEFLMILSIIDLPISSIKHKYQSVANSRIIEITPSSNLILFTKILKETETDINKKILISQNVIDELHNDINVNLNNCSIGLQYNHQTIVTNISNQILSFQLFIVIPQGAICLNSSYYTNLIKVHLEPYQTKDVSTYFYFPKEGKYQQYHPVACKNSKIISVGTSLSYNVKKEYIPSKKNEIVENNKYAKDMRIEGKLRNILSDDSIESKHKLTNILKYFEKDIFNDEDISNILYLLKNDKDFYNKLIQILRKRGYYNNKVWSFGFHHKDEQAIKEYLSTIESLKRDLGYDFESSLYSYNELDDAKIHPHLEYNPLFNARKHPFGNKNDKTGTNIANKEFNETYTKFIVDLLSLKELRIKEKLQLTYYLILQDRIDDAFEVFKKIKSEEIENNKYKNYKIQYDYIYAYLDFCFGYPDFEIAKSICNKYKDFPLTFWKEKFEEIEDQLLEYEGKEKVSMDKISQDNDKSSKKITKELREKEPKISFTINNKEGKIIIIHSNISEISIKLYLIDLETMFTRDPRISEIIEKDKDKDSNILKKNLGFVQPNYSTIIKIPKEKINKNENSTIFEIPKEYKSKNLFIEIKSESLKIFDIYLNSDLYVVITESIGELKVIDNNLKPIIKAYVKVYAELDSDEIQFYKDGYTDLNGKFNYIALNTDQLKRAIKFYIYISEEKNGALIKECKPPKNIERTGGDNLLGDIQRFRNNQRMQWRILNK